MSDAPQLEIQGSRLFSQWQLGQRVSLAITTYQAGKLFLIGMQQDGRMSIFERTFERCMGLSASRSALWMSSLYQLWRFQNFQDPGSLQDGFDATYVPTTGHTTGDVDIHDIHIQPNGSPVFVVTRFNCLATLSKTGSFKPIWKPSFIDRIAAEDRCHLNGMAADETGPRFVSCVGRSNIVEGWRGQRHDGGLVINVETGEEVSTGLSMPHSPRLYQSKLWILQTGTGEFGEIDPETGTFTPICFLPGFARGLAFTGDYAVIGVSRFRENRSFDDLAVKDRLERDGIEPKCGLAVVNLKTGDVEHLLDIQGVVQELYDVAIIPNILRPRALGFRTDEIRFFVRPENYP